MYNLGHLRLYKNIPKKRMFNSTPDYANDAYTLLQYKSHLRNEFLIPLKANGDGSGVATIRLQSLETQSVKITGNGKFYTDVSGTTVLGIESTIDTSLTSFFVKVPAGESCYLVLGKADKLSGLGSANINVIEDGVNVPYINYCAINYPLINLSVIRLFGGVFNSSIIGSIDNTPNLTYISFYLNPLSKITGSIDNTPKLTSINFQDNLLSKITGSIDNTPNLTTISFNSNPLSEITGDIGKLTKCAFCNFGGSHIGSKLTYDTPRNTIDKWPSTYNTYWVRCASMTSTMVDNLLIDLDASSVMPTGAGLIRLDGLCGAVTSASETARASLVNKGFTVIVNT